MDAISQTTFSNVFSWMKMYEFRFGFHWNLFLEVQLTIFQHWFRQWLGADQATSHYLNQWWVFYWRIYASLGLNELSGYTCMYPSMSYIRRGLSLLVKEELWKEYSRILMGSTNYTACYIYIIQTMRKIFNRLCIHVNLHLDGYDIPKLTSHFRYTGYHDAQRQTSVYDSCF